MGQQHLALTVSLLTLALAACGNPGSGAPGAVSEGEAKALEEAAEMLDDRQLPEGTLPPVDLAPDGGASEPAEPELQQDGQAE